MHNLGLKMKTPIRHLLILSSIMLLCACTGSQRFLADDTADKEGRETVRQIEINDNTEGTWASVFSQVPGVYYTSNGPRIRGGNTSFHGSNAPLIVVDGTVADLSMVQPNDVEQIRVLKGPEAAIYGIRGGAGVIEITTKRR